MQLEELRRLFKALNVTFKNDFALRRAIIYYKFVKDFYDSVTDGHVKQVLSKKAGEYEKVATALTRPGLLQSLCDILDEYILKAINKDLTTSDVTYGVYFQRMFQNYPASVDEFQDRHTQSHLALVKLALYFETNILTACQRVIGDWASLTTMFADQGTLFEELVDIETTGSDFHKGGQQVLILSFKTYPTGRLRRVVYKPSDLEADCLLVGDSAAVNVHFHPPFQDASLMEILNGLIRQHPNCQLRQFPTYKILPLNAGSGLQPDPTGKLPIRSSYGYLEYLSNEEVMLESYSSGLSDFKIFPSQDERSICTSFYGLLGQLTAVACVFSLSDLHMQNLVAHSYLPYLIDLENSLTEPINDLIDTHLIGGPDSGGALDGIVASYDDVDEASLNDQCKLIRVLPHHKYAKNRLWRAPSTMVTPYEYGEAMCNSLQVTMNLIHDCLQANNNPFGGWFTRLRKGVIVRFVPLGTNKFDINIRVAFQEKEDAGAYVKEQMKAALEGEYNSWCMDQTAAPKFLCLQESYVVNDMLQLDVPTFYHQLNTLNVLDSHGTVIDIPQSITINGQPVGIRALLNRATFFSACPLDHVCNVQLLPLSDPQTLDKRVGSFLATLIQRALQTKQPVQVYQSLVKKR